MLGVILFLSHQNLQIASLKELSEKKDKEIEKLKQVLLKIGKNQQELSSGDDKSESQKEIKILSERNKNLEEQIRLLEEENENLRNQVLTITNALDISEEELNKQRYGLCGGFLFKLNCFEI